MRTTLRTTIGCLLAGFALLGGCDAVDQTAFDQDENDDQGGAGPDGTADRTAGHRDGCGAPTGIQGTPEVSCVRPLVRNLEQPNFCKDKVRQNVMGIVGYGRGISGKPSFADSVKSDIKAGKLDAVVVHMAEGIDDHALSEWQM